MKVVFAYPYFFYGSLAMLLLVSYWRWYYYKRPLYTYSSWLPLKQLKVSDRWYKWVPFVLRLLALISLCLAIARPQVPDERTKIPIEGIDIVLVMDVSGSMQLFDDIKDPRSRIEVAKAEALKFIQKRQNDPIGLVLFGGIALSRCPLTVDKAMLQQIINETQLGIINPEGTVLSKGILTAANRLKNSHAKSKIMIVLTDGEPSADDIDPQVSIDLAKKLGIKIYTIGIGSSKGGFFNHPFFGLVSSRSPLNVNLLKRYAQETGGQFFLAESPADVERIYNTIDQLEKTEYEAPIFARYFEYFVYFLWLALFLLIVEIIGSYMWWPSL